MAAGGRKLLVVTMYAGDMRNGETRRIISEGLKSLKIGISTIQEPLRIIDGGWGEGGYISSIQLLKERATETNDKVNEKR